MKYQNLREEEIKIKVSKEYFWRYDCSKIIGNIDFSVSFYESKKDITTNESLLWAEAKKGSSDLLKSLTQLILTVGKARTFDKYMPPSMLGAFDAEKIAFIPYSDIQEIFYINDFNWNVAPSNHETREFNLILSKVKSIIESQVCLFYFQKDDKELANFIKENFVYGKFGLTKTKIDKNNFLVIYTKWLKEVKPTISFNWELAKDNGVIDGDFYLADILSEDNYTLKEKLFVVLQATQYELNRHEDKYGAFTSSVVRFNDKQVAHTQFWNKYERPPKEIYWDYIIERRDLLVPQDIRERKGSFFTPQIWVELSQRYLADVFGIDWQDEYYIWDCAAGTGNLLAGLTNKYNIWASTIDKQDVEVMKERIKNGTNLLEDHVFQFDFLNDDFSKLPKTLLEIINNPQKREKLIIYINPPYAEATTARTVLGTGDNKPGVAILHNANKDYRSKIGNASNELFALFMAVIYDKIPNCKVAQFSKMKFIQGSNFRQFKDFFKAKYLSGFIMPADSFDNVRGKFPIGFTLWDLSQKESIKTVETDAFNQNRDFLFKKKFYGDLPESINTWLVNSIKKSENYIGLMVSCAPDMQHNKQLAILSKEQERYCFTILPINLYIFCVYFAVRHSIKATWLNDRDQFLMPNEDWQDDDEFKNDCLAFTLFHSQNRISSTDGTNHWIPFDEYDVDSREKFDSNFMSQFIKGKIKPEERNDLFVVSEPIAVYGSSGLSFSQIAIDVFDAGRELWSYYHTQPKCNVNASLYDIRVYFQGRNEGGKMKSKSDDTHYEMLISNLRDKLDILALKIEPKVYEYGFLVL